MRNIINFVILVFFIAFISCEEKEENPKITTTAIKAISASRYLVKASVPEKGNIPITDYGFVYYLGTNEYSQGNFENKISLGQKLNTDSFSTEIEIQNTNYYNDYKIFAKAYITNEKGTIYAKPLSVDVLRLQATDIFPSFGKAGDTITINGKNFDLTPSNNVVTFNNINAVVTSASSTKLKVIVPDNISVNYYDSYIIIKVKTGNQSTEFSFNFTLGASPTSFSPNHGNWNTSVTIYGSGLYNATIYFNDISYNPYNSSPNSISFNIPSNITSKKFKLYVEKNGRKTEVPGGAFTMDNIEVSNFSSIKCLQGSTISIYANNINPTNSKNKLLISNQTIASEYSYSSNLQFNIPVSFPKGKYNAYVTNSLDTTLLPGQIEVVTPEVTSISPASGYPNSKYTIKGNNFINSNYTYIYFDSYSFSASILDTSTIKNTVPNIEPGTYSVYVSIGNNKIKCPETFTVLAPTITSISPASGAANSSVVISGEGFGANTYNTYVYFGSMVAYPMTVTDNQINVKVPSGITSGKWIVTVVINGTTLKNTVTFDVP